MSIHVLDTTLTFCWVINPTDVSLAQADFDIILSKPDGSTTYVDNSLTTFVAPTANSQGQATYDLLVDQLGRYQVTLSVGVSTAWVVKAFREVYIVDLPASVAVGTPGKTTSGPEVLPDPAPPPPPVDISDYTNVAEVVATQNTNYAGGVQIKLKAGAAAQAVPAGWTGYTGYANIQAALDAADSTPLDLGIHFPELPAITKYGSPTIWDRTQNSVDLGGSPQNISFDPLDEYNGAGWQAHAFGIFNYMWRGDAENLYFCVFGGEAGYWALFNGDTPEWESLQWVAGDDVYIRLSNV